MYGLSKKEYAQYVLLKQNSWKFKNRGSTTFNEAEYRKNNVTTKKNIGTEENPNLVWWDSKTQTPYDADKVANTHVDNEYTTKYKTKTPWADLQVLEARLKIGRTKAAIKGELGPLSSLKSGLSTPIEGGGLEIDFARRNRLKELEKSLPALIEKSSYKGISTEKDDNTSSPAPVKPPVKENQIQDAGDLLDLISKNQEPVTINSRHQTNLNQIASNPNADRFTKNLAADLTKEIANFNSGGILT